MRTAAGKAKVLGTILGINGSMLPSFFKGVKINIWNFHINLLHSHLGMQTPKTEWLQGTVTSGFVIIATTGCVRKRGPLYASVFNPLYRVLVALLAATVLLQVHLYVGCPLFSSLFIKA